MAVAAVIAWGGAQAASAATITVTTTADQVGMAPGCALRQAVSAANADTPQGGCPAGAGADTIRLPAGVYAVTRPGVDDLNMTGDLDVAGAGALTLEPAGDGPVVVDGGGLDRVIHKSGTGGLTLRNLTVRGGILSGIEDGGGILNSGGQLTLEGVTLIGNSASIDGGALANYAAAVIVNSTLSGNRADGSGGAIYAVGSSTTTIRSSTITANLADQDANGAGDGGGVAAAATGVVNATNTILAGNSDSSPNPADRAADCSTGPDFYPRYVFSGQPLGTGPCLVGFDPGTNRTGDAKLEPIADNGGPGPTVLPAADSPVIDAGGSAAPDICPPTDQRGVARPVGAGCDIGAVERDPEGRDAPGGGGQPGTAPGRARLKFEKPRFRTIKARAGTRVRLRARLRNRGTATAKRVKVCLVIKGRKARRTIKPAGRRCRTVGRILPGRAKVAKLRVRVRRGAAPGRVKVRFRAGAAGKVGARSRASFIRVVRRA